MKYMGRNISIFSFFSGIGILDYAFEKNRYNIVLVNEFNSSFLEAYQFARNSVNIKPPLYGYRNNSAERFSKRKGKQSLLQLMDQERKKGNLVGFIGGPPCPDFSVAGKNAGAKGENGRLTKTYFDVICRCQPDFFLFENVKGLVRTEKHKAFFEEMKYKVKANGYCTDDTVANALAYGVPQFRERVFMVGIKDSLLKGQVDGFKFDWYKHALFDTNEVLKKPWPTTHPFEVDGDLPYPSKEIPKKLTVEYWFQKNDVIHHLNGKDIFAVKKGRDKIERIPEGDTSGKSFKRLHRWRYSPTAAYGHNEVHLHPYKARRISVAEAMAIQSIPKEFVVNPSLSLSQKFKMIGNGVPYRMAFSISRTLYETLQSLEEDSI